MAKYKCKECNHVWDAEFPVTCPKCDSSNIAAVKKFPHWIWYIVGVAVILFIIIMLINRPAGKLLLQLSTDSNYNVTIEELSGISSSKLCKDYIIEMTNSQNSDVTKLKFNSKTKTIKVDGSQFALETCYYFKLLSLTNEDVKYDWKDKNSFCMPDRYIELTFRGDTVHYTAEIAVIRGMEPEIVKNYEIVMTEDGGKDKHFKLPSSMIFKKTNLEEGKCYEFKLIDVTTGNQVGNWADNVTPRICIPVTPPKPPIITQAELQNLLDKLAKGTITSHSKILKAAGGDVKLKGSKKTLKDVTFEMETAIICGMEPKQYIVKEIEYNKNGQIKDGSLLLKQK